MKATQFAAPSSNHVPISKPPTYVYSKRLFSATTFSCQTCIKVDHYESFLFEIGAGDQNRLPCRGSYVTWGYINSLNIIGRMVLMKVTELIR